MTEERIIAYLLEELPEEEAERLEDECLSEEGWPAESESVEEDLIYLRSVEEGLIEDYLRGGLTPERRRRFEEKYLTTGERVERVRVTAALLRLGDERAAVADAAEIIPAGPSREKPRGTWFGALWGGRLFASRTALAVASLAVVIAGVFLISRLISPPGRGVVMLTLTPASASRGPGAELTKVKLPADAGTLRIALMLPEGSVPPARYRVELEDGGGKIVSPEVEGQDARSVSVVIPSASLGRGQYAIRVFAVTTEGAEQRVRGSYLFYVE